MLVQNSLNQLVGEIVSFGFPEGTEMIAKLIEVSEDHIVVSNPLNLVPIRSQNGKEQQIGMSPATFSGTLECVSFNRAGIKSWTKSNKNTQEEYKKAVSPVLVPESTIIT